MCIRDSVRYGGNLPRLGPRIPRELDPETCTQLVPHEGLEDVVNCGCVTHQVPAASGNRGPSAVQALGHVRNGHVHVPMRIPDHPLSYRTSRTVSHGPAQEPAAGHRLGAAAAAMVAAHAVRGGGLQPVEGAAVSYTHLTLPTI